MIKKLFICVAALALLNNGAEAKKNLNVSEASTHGFGPAAARDFLKTLTVADGYEVTVFASEPLLRKPSNIDVDERGRVWVSEITNYGSSRKPWGLLEPKGDRILILEDTNGDGVADKQTVFYQGRDIDCPYGVCVVGEKVYVGRSPDMFVFTRDSQDKVLTKQKLFADIDGFDSDHCAHAFVFGPDGKLYFNFGNHAGHLNRPNGELAVDTDGVPISVDGRKLTGTVKTTVYRQGLTFRCNLDGSELETLGHNFRNPMDVCVDSFGNMFQADNDDDGNRGTRVVWVMEHGNFGYVDEMTGAGWHERRSNLEEDIPHRHWHQNDPGVVPNLLFNGAGAPCAMTVYEGNLMPELRGALLHCDAGPREVRDYFLEPDGAGFKATKQVLVTSSDSWFRPCDVCIGPDGAIYVADWHDGMVGGHDMVDRDPKKMRGRIYRIVPKKSKRTIPKFDFATLQGSAEALKSPNLAVRANAWLTLHDAGPQAEGELLRLWKSDDVRLRARALQLLARVPGRSTTYLDEAAHDTDWNIRLATLRIAREIKADVIRYVQLLVRDVSPQVRRECAISLRHNDSPNAAELWAELALQHDGKDRWYLEALGIGADKNESKFFESWLKAVGSNWDAPAGRDIIWRSRTSAALPYLAKLISNPQTPDKERARYFRSFDFIKGPEKETALVELLTEVY